jgi:hypothetical protein
MKRSPRWRSSPGTADQVPAAHTLVAFAALAGLFVAV